MVGVSNMIRVRILPSSEPCLPLRTSDEPREGDTEHFGETFVPLEFKMIL